MASGMSGTLSWLALAALLAQLALSKPAQKPVKEDASLDALYKLVQARLAAQRLEETIRSLSEEARSDPWARANGGARPKAGPAELDAVEYDVLSGEDRLPLVLVDKRSKNFLKLANQAARGFGRK